MLCYEAEQIMETSMHVLAFAQEAIKFGQEAIKHYEKHRRMNGVWDKRTMRSMVLQNELRGM